MNGSWRNWKFLPSPSEKNLPLPQDALKMAMVLPSFIDWDLFHANFWIIFCLNWIKIWQNIFLSTRLQCLKMHHCAVLRSVDFKKTF